MKNYYVQTMLIPDTTAISILLAEKELESKDLAKLTELSMNTIYAIRRGCYCKPKYIGKIAKALGCSVKDIIKEPATDAETAQEHPEAVASI